MGKELKETKYQERMLEEAQKHRNWFDWLKKEGFEVNCSSGRPGIFVPYGLHVLQGGARKGYLRICVQHKRDMPIQKLYIPPKPLK